uniref:uncharacterized protein LOC120326313 n=1 Tax=Styela clava TaxID=7725 RepID=UPI0019392D8A|nr:uncharacterized protein LOC120326313 [Styela clava]
MMEFGFGERKKRVKRQFPRSDTVGFTFGSSLRPRTTEGSFGNFSQPRTTRGLFGNFSQPSSSRGSFREGPSWPHTTNTSTQTEELDLPCSGIAVRASKPSHGNLVLSSLRDLKDQDIVCDFTMKVGVKSFMVHRAVLVACSEYFRAMFKHDTKECQENAVCMKDVEAEAVKECIDYMYSGNANIKVDTAGDILHAASLMQLEELRESCFKTIEENVSSENCLDIADILEIYSCDDLQKKVELCIKNNFFDVIKTEKFASKSFDDLISFVSNFAKCDEFAWKALKSWINYNESERSEYMDELIKLIKLDQFPSANLLQSIANDSLIKDSQKRLDLFIRRIFLSTGELGKNLNMDNFFIVRQFQNGLKHTTKEAQNIIDEFLIDQYEQILIQDEFVYLTEKEVFMILGAQNVQCLAPEELRWNAIIKWLKYDSERMHLVHEMIKNVDFSQLPKQFIQDTVRQEPLVKDSPGCMMMLMDGVFNTKPNYSNPTECIAVMLENGLIHAFYLDGNRTRLEIPTIPTDTGSRIFSFNGKLCLFNTTGIYYFGTNKEWIRKTVARGVPPHSKVVVLKNMIYFISEDASCGYDTLNDRWNMKLPVCDGDVATLGNDIYAFQGKQNASVLNENGTEWHSIYRGDHYISDDEDEESISLKFSVASFVGDIYAVTFGSNSLGRFSQQDSEWYDVSMFPGSAPEKACLFVADGKLIVLSKTSSEATLYAYDKICNQWMTMKVLPWVATAQMKMGECHNFSACSFRFDS